MNTTKETTPAPPTDGAQLLDQVGATFSKYVVFASSDYLVAATLWTVATHGIGAWNAAPRLVIKGPQKRCGKSRLLEVTAALGHLTKRQMGTSAAAAYRTISDHVDYPPTLLIDEADTIFGPNAGENELLRGILNAGFERGVPLPRYDAQARTVVELPTFAMAALAGIGTMPDTIEDRAVVIKMRRRGKNEKVAPWRIRRDKPPAQALGKQLTKWVKQNQRTLQQAEPEMPLEDRAADVWEPLISIADLAGGEWSTKARETAKRLVAEQELDDNDQSLPTRLLTDCREVFGNKETISTIDLLRGLRGDLEAPWVTLGHSGLTPRTLAQMLKEFDIQSTRYRDRNNQQRGYTTNAFRDAWDRYCPHPSESVTSVTSVTNPGQMRDTSGPPRRNKPSQQPLTATCINCRGHHPDHECPHPPPAINENHQQ